MFISNDFGQFKSLFIRQLKTILSDDELGAFILVLANSQQDAFLKNALDLELKQTFISLKNKFNSGELKATQDDSDVFKQLLIIDLNKTEPWQYKSLSNWELVYNSMRKLRPARTSNEILTSIYRDFDKTKFHFNKPFLKPEILWQGKYKGKTVRVLYNKFPFSDYHLLLAVSPEENHPQFLTHDMHEFVLSMVRDVEKSFPGFGVGFNCLAAGASVNHLHFQGFIRKHEFPVEKDCWRHNGGDTDYPLSVKCFLNSDLTDGAWPYIKSLIDQDVAFNCIYRKNSCYVIPRKYQGAVDLPDWLQGAGWLDVAGVMTVSDKETFASINEVLVTDALRLLSVV